MIYKKQASFTNKKLWCCDEHVCGSLYSAVIRQLGIYIRKIIAYIKPIDTAHGHNIRHRG